MSLSRARRRVGLGLVAGWLVAPLLASALLAAGGADENADRRPVVYAADVDSLIHPVSAEFIGQSIARADADGARLVVLKIGRASCRERV